MAFSFLCNWLPCALVAKRAFRKFWHKYNPKPSESASR